MPFYRILVRQDAWINHTGVVQASDSRDAADAGMEAWNGRRPDIVLTEDDAVGFDHAECDHEECEEITEEEFRAEGGKPDEEEDA